MNQQEFDVITKYEKALHDRNLACAKILVDEFYAAITCVSEAYTNDAHNLILSLPFIEEILVALFEAEDTKAMILHDRLMAMLDGKAKS